MSTIFLLELSPSLLSYDQYFIFFPTTFSFSIFPLVSSLVHLTRFLTLFLLASSPFPLSIPSSVFPLSSFLHLLLFILLPLSFCLSPHHSTLPYLLSPFPQLFILFPSSPLLFPSSFLLFHPFIPHQPSSYSWLHSFFSFLPFSHNVLVFSFSLSVPSKIQPLHLLLSPILLPLLLLLLLNKNKSPHNFLKLVEKRSQRRLMQP